MVEIVEEIKEEFVLLQVSGDVDASSSIHLDNAIEKAIAAEKNILVDLTKLNYISSAGLGVFISYLDELKSTSRNFVLFGLNEKVKQVFNILGLDNLITIAENFEDALKAINGG